MGTNGREGVRCQNRLGVQLSTSEADLAIEKCSRPFWAGCSRRVRFAPRSKAIGAYPGADGEGPECCSPHDSKLGKWRGDKPNGQENPRFQGTSAIDRR